MIGAAARKILGSHIWQAGASKYEDRARLDITHHRRLTRDVIELIESEVNALILANHPITTKFYAREEADKKYGNTLYQGGAPKYKEVRVVEIPNIDAQACAGTHVTSTLKVEAVKVLRTERVQDGVERIEFSAGPSAVEASQKERALLEKTADHLGVPIDQAPNAAQKFVKEWKELRNKVSSLEKELASFKSSSLESENIGKINFYSDNMGETNFGEVQKLVRTITSESNNIIAIGSCKGDKATVILASSPGLDFNCGSTLKEVLASVGSSGGGKETYAQGACSASDIDAVLSKIKNFIS